MTCYAQVPLIMPNFITLIQTIYEKITTFSIFTPQGDDPLCQSLPIWVAMYSKDPYIKLANSSHSQNPCTRYLLPNLSISLTA